MSGLVVHATAVWYTCFDTIFMTPMVVSLPDGALDTTPLG